ncbi:hypothetical protein V5O48_007599 [Marasmius crinis-equi]|uniref:Uncharacterized protein n=1 Tax=Marasmius crinis-equi TaxID=585013 RepID=A0ABR3FG88_9AGAR
MSGETTHKFPSYEEAAKDACKWVNVEGKKNLNPSDLVLYEGRLGSGKGHIVGVGLRTNAGVITPYIRLDIESQGDKAIHFNAVRYYDGAKLAAVITPTIAMSPPDRENLYNDYLKGIENRSAQFLWEWWKTGVPPTR